MRLYLVRHGEAKSAQEDPERSLTEQGQKDIQRMADWAARVGLHVDQIWHSGKRRAQQTAEILADRLSPSEGTIAVPGLAPNDDVRPTAEAIHHETRSLMLVGHLPFLARLVSALLIENPDRPLVHFAAGGMVCLEREGTSWTVIWVMAPELIV